MSEPLTPQPRDHRQPGHFWADNEIIDVYLPKIGIHGFAVYMLLTKFANARNGQCDPSIPTVAKMLDVSETTVKKAIKKLKDNGLINVEARKHPKKSKQHDTNLYTLLTVPKLGHQVTQGVGQDVTQGGAQGDPGVGHQVTGNNTHKNKTQLTKEDTFSQAANAVAGGAKVDPIAEELDKPLNSKPLEAFKEKKAVERLSDSDDGWYVVRGDTAWGPQASKAQAERITDAGGGTTTQRQGIGVNIKRILTPLPEPSKPDGQNGSASATFSSNPAEVLAERKRLAAEKQAAPRPRNPVVDAIALGSFGLKEIPKGKNGPGGRIGKIAAEVKECTPEEFRATLADDLPQMYAWYKTKYPSLSAPAQSLSICKYLNEWRESGRVTTSTRQPYVSKFDKVMAREAAEKAKIAAEKGKA